MTMRPRPGGPPHLSLPFLKVPSDLHHQPINPSVSACQARRCNRGVFGRLLGRSLAFVDEHV